MSRNIRSGNIYRHLFILGPILIAISNPVWAFKVDSELEKYTAAAILNRAIESFNAAYKPDLQVYKVSLRRRVKNTFAAVKDMLAHATILTWSDEDNRLTVVSKEGLIDTESFHDILLSQLSHSDLLLDIYFTDNAHQKDWLSVNSMSEDGKRFSGSLFLTTRLPENVREPVSQPNTRCRTIYTEYLWGVPAEIFTGCARVTCAQDTAEICKVSEVHCTSGIFATCEILPKAGSDGSVENNNCYGYFDYAWTTGFQSIKVSLGKFSFEIEGYLGQSGMGSFSAEEACPGVRLVERVVLAEALFDFNKSHLTKGGTATLKRIVTQIKRAGNLLALQVTGHTDSIGSKNDNIVLSEKRAQNVKDFLIRLGLEESKITARGAGESRPIATNDIPEGRARNRRVEIVATVSG